MTTATTQESISSSHLAVTATSPGGLQSPEQAKQHSNNSQMSLPKARVGLRTAGRMTKLMAVAAEGIDEELEYIHLDQPAPTFQSNYIYGMFAATFLAREKKLRNRHVIVTHTHTHTQTHIQHESKA